MIISYDYGHGCGQDRGAEGIVNEETEIRKYAPYCVNDLIRSGHTCIDCTPSGNLTVTESINARIYKANASGSQLHICFHVNAGGGHGAEIEIKKENSRTIAQSVLDNICSLGFTDRGVISRDNLGILNYTNMPAILIEPFFCDSQSDCSIYNAESLGNAIAEGILKTIGGNYVPIPKPINKPNNYCGYVDTRYLPILDNFVTSADNVVCKELPDNNSKSNGTIVKAGTPLRIYAKCGEWYLVNNAIPQYIAIEYAKAATNLTVLKTVKVNAAEGARCYENPSKADRNNGVVPQWKELSVYKEMNGFYLVNPANANLQWVSKSDVSDK